MGAQGQSKRAQGLPVGLPPQRISSMNVNVDHESQASDLLEYSTPKYWVLDLSYNGPPSNGCFASMALSACHAGHPWQGL